MKELFSVNFFSCNWDVTFYGQFMSYWVKVLTLNFDVLLSGEERGCAKA